MIASLTLWLPLPAPPLEDELVALEAPPTPLVRLAWGDVDGDGIDDVVALDEGGAPRLLLQSEAGTFEDVTARVGLAEVRGMHRAALGDADGDGRLDLFLAAWRGKSAFLAQTEGGAFVDRTDDAGLPRWAAPLEADWRDVDGDGHLDLWLTTSQDDLLYRNDGAGGFERLDLGLAPRAGVIAERRPQSLAEARAMRGLDAFDTGGPGTGTNGPGAPGIGFEIACALGIQDQANPSDCLSASTVPTLGMLYPISGDLYVQAGSGRVGVGTTSPAHRLDVSGDVRATGRLRSTVGGGTPPLAVSSTTRVPNLNADFLDGFHAADFAVLPIVTSDLADGAVTTAKLATASVTTGKIATGAVNSSDIQDGAVTAADLAADSVGSSEISFAAVGSTEIAANSISDYHVNPLGAIQGTKIVPGFGNQIVSTSDEFHAQGYGTATDPAYRFTGAEATGLSSPTANQLSLLSNGQTRFSVRSDGRVVAGPTSGYSGTVFSSRSDTGATAIFGGNESAATGATGIFGRSVANEGVGVHGFHQAASGETYGVQGTVNSAGGYGVFGYNTSSADGIGVYGFAGDFTVSAGTGVFGSGGRYGVRGLSAGGGGAGVRGVGNDSATVTDGVIGQSVGSTSYGVWGINPASYGVYSSGDLGASGVKSFLQPHPEDAAKVVRFVCLEGDEAGTYFRGSSELVEGVALIDVPEVFRMVTDPDEVTVQVTPRGPGTLWVQSADLHHVVVRGDVDVAFDYFVNGVRLGYRDVELIQENRAYRPLERGVPYGEHLPAEVRQLLVDNGTLNGDFTPNEATAARLGWELAEPGAREAERERLSTRPAPVSSPEFAQDPPARAGGR